MQNLNKITKMSIFIKIKFTYLAKIYNHALSCVKYLQNSFYLQIIYIKSCLLQHSDRFSILDKKQLLIVHLKTITNIL